MPFTSFAFILFLSSVLLIFNAMPVRFRPLALLISSYIFYGSFYWHHVGLLFFVATAGYVGGRFLEQRRTSVRLTIVVGLILLPLVTMKYLPPLVQAGVNHGFWDKVLPIALPVGVSFYTLQTISYVVDVHRRVLPAEQSFLALNLYVALFPQLLAGPISRARALLPQIIHLARSTTEDLYIGGKYLIWGFFCKLVVADNIALIVDRMLQAPREHSGASLTATFVLYSFQIYFDFLGYTTIARGVGRLFGFRFPSNFINPYAAGSLREFWRRWHITLSSWFRDYVYVPLGGNTTHGVSRMTQVLLVFLASGLWHGAATNFLVWGGLHGAGYLAEETLRRAGARC